MNLDSLSYNLKRWWPIGLGVVSVLLITFFILGQLNKGSLEVSSNPAGAEVSLNGSKKSPTPTKIGGLDPGTYEVAVTHPGFVEDSKQVKVANGQTAKISFDLQKSPQEYIISSDRVTDVAIANGQVLYNLSVNQRDRELWSFDIATKQKTKLLGPDRLRIDKVYWSGDGRALVNDFSGDAYLLDNGNLSKLGFRGYGFSWSPDNKSLSFANDRFYGPTTPEGVNTYEIASGKLTNIANVDSVTAQVTSWSPDGGKIFYHNQSLEDIGKVTVINRDGSGKSAVINQTDGVSRVAWSDDSRFIFANIGGILYKQPLSGEGALKVFDSATQDIAFSVAGSDLTVVGSRETGQVWKIIGSGGKRFYQVSSGSLTDIVSRGNLVVVVSSKQLVLLTEK